MSGSNIKVDEYLKTLPKWKKTNLEIFRKLVHGADFSITEDLKWSVPVFIINNKMVFAMAAFKAHTKFNFIANGALIDDKDHLFNNGFDSKKSRGIDLKENEEINNPKLLVLIKAAIENISSK